MGLDTYAVYMTEEEYQNWKTSPKSKGIPGKEFAYWRKHYGIHNYFMDLYYKQKNSEEFNLEPVELTLKDIKKLKKLAKSNNLSLPNEPFEYSDLDKKFVKKTKKLLKDNYHVICYSWW